VAEQLPTPVILKDLEFSVISEVDLSIRQNSLCLEYIRLRGRIQKRQKSSRIK
jgi:hypothetical protein